MRLYSRMGAAAVTDAGKVYEAAADGAFDFPAEVGERLHGFAVAGSPMWETDVERQHRLVTEEMERRKDPATLLDAVQQIVKAAQAVAPQTAAPAPAPSTESEPPPVQAQEIPVRYTGGVTLPEAGATAGQPEAPAQVVKSEPGESLAEPQVHPGFSEDLHGTEVPADGSEHEITNEHPGGTL